MSEQPRILISDLGPGMQGVTVYGEPSNGSSRLSDEQLDGALAAGLEEDNEDDDE